MLDITILFKIGGAGIILVILDKVISLISQLFSTVKTMFMF